MAEYIVQPGDTPYLIAKKFGVPVSELVRINGITNVRQLQPGQRLIIPEPGAPAPPSGRVYIVQQGDTLFSIARRFGTTVDAIARANGIADPSRIQVGQRLVIPAPGVPPAPPPSGQVYVVQPGDTLFLIARRFGTTVDAIAAANGIADPSRIQVGQRLIIPAPGVPPGPPPPGLPPLPPGIPPGPVPGAIYRGLPKRVVALTYDSDDLAVPAALLPNLAAQGIKATFFLAGIWINKFKTTAQQIVAAGHQIANHSYSHIRLAGLSDAAVLEEIVRWRPVALQITSNLPPYFRPPFGDVSTRVVNIAASAGYRTIMWSSDSRDWQEPGVATIVSNVLRDIGPGVIIIMHAFSQQGAQALPQLAQQIRARGFAIGNVTSVLTP